MRCRKHFSDYSSGVGVCASCLREKLHILIQTQSNDQTVLLVRPHLEEDEHRKSDAIQPQIMFPRSVSPYVSRRKSDNTAAHLQRFYSTPQIGPNGVITEDRGDLYTRRRGRFGILSKLFRSKTQKLDAHLNFDARPRNSTSGVEAAVICETVTETTTSWFSSLFSKKKMSSKSFPAFGNRRNPRGMSPTAESEEECGDKLSEYSLEASPPRWKETPIRLTPNSRKRQNHRNAGGMAFCLSPLVRPSPNRSWTLKGVTPESVIPNGDVRVPVKPKPHLGDAASFKGNRSRKLANFGRSNPKY